MDFWTLYIVTAITGLFLGLIELAAYFTGQFNRWPLWWGGANLLFALGSICVAAQTGGAGAHVVMLGNLLIVAGHVLLVGGVRDFAGRRLPAFAIVVALATSAVAALFADLEAFAFRAASLSAGAALLDLVIVAEAARLARREGLRSAWIMTVLFSISTLMYAARAVLLADGAFGQDTLFGAGSSAHALFAAPAAAILVLRGMILLLLAAERGRKHLEGLAYRDPLTGVLTRGGLRHAKAILLHGGRREFIRASVLLIDVDHFKAVNDMHGHDAGDEVLKLVAEVARETIPQHGLVARWGGDEFVILLPGTAAHEAADRAERLRLAFDGRLRTAWPDRPTMMPTLSVGIAEGEVRVGGIGTLVKAADAALYDVKRAGRNAVGMRGGADPVPVP